MKRHKCISERQKPVSQHRGVLSSVAPATGGFTARVVWLYIDVHVLDAVIINRV